MSHGLCARERCKRTAGSRAQWQAVQLQTGTRLCSADADCVWPRMLLLLLLTLHFRLHTAPRFPAEPASRQRHDKALVPADAR